MYNTSVWGDQLLQIDIGGNVPCGEDQTCWCISSENFSYNSIGNPTYYRNKTLEWGKVNQLTYFDGNTFTYDAAGIRTSKNDSITYEYHGDQLHKETRGSTTIEYIYGIDGVIGFIYSQTPYYYIKNLFGDVTKIANTQNEIVAEYLYDAWGNHTITLDTNGIGSINPIRYRSYYYDTETGLYYLKTRYYDPEIGRFISPDSTKYLDPESIHGLNLYAYCLNNPVMYTDPSGHSIIATILISFAIGATLSFSGTVAADYIDDGKIFNGSISGWEYLGNTLAGGVTGTFLGVAFVTGNTTCIDLGFSMLDGGLSAILSGQSYAKGSLCGFIAGVGSFMVGKIFKNLRPDRLNILKRISNSMIYDISNSIANRKNAAEIFAITSVDILLDFCFSTISYYYINSKNTFIKSLLYDFTDTIFDLYQAQL